MRNRTGRFAILLSLALLPPGIADAQKLDKDDKKWLDDVRPILLPEEEKTFKALKEKDDRLEFQKIFWARRDPDLATPESEFQAEFLKARAEADQAYRLPGRAGSATDCGRTAILLGKPDDVQRESTAIQGLRPLETWTYRDKPGQTFQGGKAVIAFDEECRAPGGFSAQLDRVAAARVIQPNIDYRFGKDGRLVKLVDLLPKDTAARALFKQPRQDFPTATQASYLKTADGGTVLLGLLQGDAGGLSVVESRGVKSAKLSVAMSAVAEDGKEAAWTEQTMNAPVGPDGRFMASVKIGLKPGRYTLKAGAVDLGSSKASLTSIPIEVPNLSQVSAAADGSEKPLLSGTVMVVRGIQEVPPNTPDDPADPLGAFRLTTARLIPLLSSELRRTDTVSFFYQIYDLHRDPGTGKSRASARLRIMREGKGQITSSAEVPIETESGVFGTEVGPIPLESLEPGKYIARLEASDKISQKAITQDCPFEILP